MTRLTHALVFVGGWIAFGLGAVGVVIPVLPTTPFMLLAAACFAKTSPRFHQWLIHSRLFGSLIRNWETGRYIEKTAKRRALAIVALTFGLSIVVVDPNALKALLAALWLTCSVIIGRLPTQPEPPSARKSD
ncbi:YbaN family protein [Reinekea blandensis]|uniref:Inner membrane protein n=1 Tax=Reinekea blandensis MED297 TaxID=314283 RepID=A4BEH0_9GAMM|nr:YbaN family protein [Reinekea blandensis]EAR09397.1 hypothetical protein MED297_02217 [Reinekea sp. MED297] [Reinekea blandensis MED297]